MVTRRAYRPRTRRTAPTRIAVDRAYPLECVEQANYFAHLDAQGWPWTEHYTVPNAGKRGWKAQQQALLEGIKRGIPDTHLAVAANKPGDYLLDTPDVVIPRRYLTLYVEMKRQRAAYGKSESTWASKISDDQADWIMRLRKLGHAAVAAYGADEAIAIFELYRRGRLVLPAGLYFVDPAPLLRGV